MTLEMLGPLGWGVLLVGALSPPPGAEQDAGPVDHCSAFTTVLLVRCFDYDTCLGGGSLR